MLELAGLLDLQNHPRPNRIVVAFIDDDKSASPTIFQIRIGEERLGQLEGDLRDVVHEAKVVVTERVSQVLRSTAILDRKTGFLGVPSQAVYVAIQVHVERLA